MYCPKCGRKVPDAADFCPDCGKRMTDLGNRSEISTLIESRKRVEIGFGDRLTDKIASKLTGKKVETIAVSLDEIIALTRAVMEDASSERDLKKIAGIVCGHPLCPMAFYTTENQRYDVYTYFMAAIASRGINNYVRITDKSTGKGYQWKHPFIAGKYKRAAKQIYREVMLRYAGSVT